MRLSNTDLNRGDRPLDATVSFYQLASVQRTL